MFDSIRNQVTWEKQHIKDINGSEYDIWVFYEYAKFGKRQICVCHNEEEFKDTKRYYGFK